jgi:transposase-like protein
MEVQDSGTSAGFNGSALKARAARSKWTAQQRREILEASMVEGAVIGEVAERYGVRAALIGSWRRQLERQPVRGAGAKNAPQFAAVRVDRVSTEGVIEIDLASRCIRVRGIVDAAMLREVLAATR